ncbi:MAG: flagellar biosynthetic protein FliR [Planctomycetia bacterium]|nr:flagellar biosynthetic protein FliR [Planctomycetia bacterium]
MDRVLIFALVLCRISGLVGTAPLFGTRAVPMQFRALLAIALSLLVAPLYLTTHFAYPVTGLRCLLMFGGEVLVGVVLGCGVSLLLTGAVMSGRLISQLTGLSMAEVFNPELDEGVPVYGQLLFIVALAVFVASGGHRLVVGSLLETFRDVPPGAAGIPTSLRETAVTLVTQSFQLALRAAAPALSALMISTLLLAVISRAVPQWNMMAVGYGVNGLLTLGVLLATIGASTWLFSDQLAATLKILEECIRTSVVSS